MTQEKKILKPSMHVELEQLITAFALQRFWGLQKPVIFHKEPWSERSQEKWSVEADVFKDLFRVTVYSEENVYFRFILNQDVMQTWINLLRCAQVLIYENTDELDTEEALHILLEGMLAKEPKAVSIRKKGRWVHDVSYRHDYFVNNNLILSIEYEVEDRRLYCLDRQFALDPFLLEETELAKAKTEALKKHLQRLRRHIQTIQEIIAVVEGLVDTEAPISVEVEESLPKGRWEGRGSPYQLRYYVHGEEAPLFLIEKWEKGLRCRLSEGPGYKESLFYLDSSSEVDAETEALKKVFEYIQQAHKSNKFILEGLTASINERKT
jgi:hypothetical protein